MVEPLKRKVTVGEDQSTVEGNQGQILTKDLTTNELLTAILKRLDRIVAHLEIVTEEDI